MEEAKRPKKTKDNSVSNVCKALCIQFCPEICNPEKNKKKLVELLLQHENSELDLILFPEMALSGYDLKTIEVVDSQAEEAGKGVAFSFFSEIARKFKAYVFAGFPEKSGPKFYNSMYCLDREGKSIMTYRKTFLYEVDKPFYAEGDGFKTFELTTLAGKVLKASPIICMDLNPKDFGDFEKFEFANYAKDNNVDLIIFCANWLKSNPNLKDDPKEVLNLVNYFLIRLHPLLDTKKKKIGFLCANRVGEEGTIKYAGTSCGLIFPSPKLIGVLGQTTEAVLPINLPF